MEEENIKYDTREEIMAFLKRQREIHTIEECDNIEQIMFDRVRKVLDFRDLMKLHCRGIKVFFTDIDRIKQMMLEK